jgi:hypothetical protein
MSRPRNNFNTLSLYSNHSITALESVNHLGHRLGADDGE